MHLEGSFQVDASQEKVYAFLCDPNRISRCIPDIESLEVVSQDQFKARVKVGVALVRGTITLTGKIVDKVSPKHARLVAEGSGIGSSLRLESIFDLSSTTDNHTSMRWSADTEIGGLIAGIGAKLLQKNAEKQVAVVFDKMKVALTQLQ